MKTRINSKAGKTINILDRVCQNANKIVDELSVTPSIKDRMWMDIEKKIASINKKVLSWFLISTASVSVLIASTVLIHSYEYNSKEPTQHGLVTNFDKPHSLYKTIIDQNISNEYHITSLRHKQINIRSEPLKYINTIEIPSFKSTEVMKTIKIAPIKNIFSPSSVESSIVLGLSMSALPEIGVDYKIYTRIKENKIASIYLGLSAAISNYKSTVNEQQNSHLGSQNYFSNITFKVENTLKESTWNGKISYLLNKNKNSLFEKNTVRLSLQRNINKHVKIGPELIMTNNFKNYYPGFSITVES